MKKLIVLFLAGLLILAFGATAYAQKLEFRASGFIDTQTVIANNVPQMNYAAGIYGVVNGNYSIDPFPNLQGVGVGPFGTKYEALALGLPPPPGLNKNGSNWESRAHLKFDAVMGPSLSGTIYFEIDSARWGNAFGFGKDVNDVLNTPFSGFAGNGREGNNFGAWTTDRLAVEVKNIYFDVGLPYFGVPWPVTVRIGAQPLGFRPGILFYSDGTGVTAGIKIGDVLINPMYAKAVASPDFSHQDSDVYGLQANAKIGTITVGGYGLLYRMGTYPFFAASSDIVGTTQLGLVPVVAGTMKSNMWWLGAYASGKAGPVDFDFDFVYDFGEVNSELSPVPHVTYNGWASRLNVEFPWEKFKFGVTGMYASGSDTRHSDASGTPGALTSMGTFSKHVASYVVPPGSEQGPVNSESIVMYSMEAGATGGYGIANNANYASLNRGGFGGTWFAKLYASAKLAPWYKVTAQALYIGDTTSHGDTFGNSLKLIGPSAMNFKDNQTIGVELDIFQDIQIYKNLRFWMGYGYMFAGNAMAINPGITEGPVRLFRNTSPENPWAFRTRLIYTF